MLKTKMQTGLPAYIEGESTTSYTYNMVGQRVQRQTLSVSYFYILETPKFEYQSTQEGRKLKTQQSCDEKYVFDGANVIADYDGDASDAYLRGYLTSGLDNNEILFTDNGGCPDDVHYYFKDALGNIRQIINDSEVPDIEGYYDYYAFGDEYSSETSNFSGNRYCFTARELNSESDMYFYRARIYNSEIGTFTSTDPINSINLYTYCRNNPINLIDPLGLTQQRGFPNVITPEDIDWICGMSQDSYNEVEKVWLNTEYYHYMEAIWNIMLENCPDKYKLVQPDFIPQPKVQLPQLSECQESSTETKPGDNQTDTDEPNLGLELAKQAANLGLAPKIVNDVVGLVTAIAAMSQCDEACSKKLKFLKQASKIYSNSSTSENCYAMVNKYREYLLCCGMNRESIENPIKFLFIDCNN